jgi:Zn finger protein HypA/HybF involved in hydrogenase expression
LKRLYDRRDEMYEKVKSIYLRIGTVSKIKTAANQAKIKVLLHLRTALKPEPTGNGFVRIKLQGGLRKPRQTGKQKEPEQTTEEAGRTPSCSSCRGNAQSKR